MTAQQLIAEHRANTRRLYDDLVRVQATAELLAITPQDEIASYFTAIDAEGNPQPREGLDLSPDEFAAAMQAMTGLLGDAEAAMPQLRKLL